MSKYIISGLPCSGKTSLLNDLKKRSSFNQFKFYDLDSFLEENILKTTISDYVNSNGWDFFREKEGRALEELLNIKGPAFIALGGGALNENILKLGYPVLWIQASLDTCWDRMKDDETRPLRNLGEEAVKAILKDRLKLSENVNIHIKLPLKLEEFCKILNLSLQEQEKGHILGQ